MFCSCGRRTLRRQPGHNVGDLLIGHGLAGDVVAPVGRVEVRTAGDDDGAQPLVGDQAEIGGFDGPTCFRTALSPSP